VALAVSYQTVVTANATTSTALYTTSTTGYQRDLVVTNGGASTCYISASIGATAATSTVGFAIPTGGSITLTQCQVPTSTILYGNAAASPAGGLSVSIGYASVVSVV
jgi:hypothetical protein